LQVEGRFSFPQLIVVISKIMQVVILFTVGRNARIEVLVGLVWLDGILVPLGLWFIFPSRRMLRFTWEWSPRVRRILASGAIVTVVGFLGEITAFAYRWFGSFLPAGSISLYFYVSKIVPICIGFAGAVIYRALLPTLSRLAAQRNLTSLREEIQRAYRVSMLIIIPMIALLWIGRDSVLGILFLRNSVKPEQIAIASQLILYLLPTIVFGSMMSIPTAVIYAIHRFDVWLYIMAYTVVMIYGFSALLIPHFGILGLAMASSLHATIAYTTTMWLAERLTIRYSLYRFLPWTLRLIFAAALFGMVSRFLAGRCGLVAIHEPIQFLLVEISIFAVTYPLGLWILRIPEARDVYSHLLTALRWRESAV
jgi:putative peptidoglycan lipid II flippase